MPWVWWERISLPKSFGGWALKNIFNFTKVLAAKVVWRLIATNSLWTDVVWHKYIAPISIIDWFKNSVRQASGVSVIWKVILKSMEVIRQGLAWKLDNGLQLHIGLDPQPGSENTHTLPQNLSESLAQENIHSLYQVVGEASTLILQQG